MSAPSGMTEERLCLRHGDVMEALAGAEALLLPSRNETFSIVAFEAVCHGVPVTCLEAPLAHEPFPELTWPWGKWVTTSLKERQAMQAVVPRRTPLEALGRRLEAVLHVQSAR